MAPNSLEKKPYVNSEYSFGQLINRSAFKTFNDKVYRCMCVCLARWFWSSCWIFRVEFFNLLMFLWISSNWKSSWNQWKWLFFWLLLRPNYFDSPASQFDNCFRLIDGVILQFDYYMYCIVSLRCPCHWIRHSRCSHWINPQIFRYTQWLWMVCHNETNYCAMAL